MKLNFFIFPEVRHRKVKCTIYKPFYALLSARVTFTVLTALIIAKSSHRSVSKLNKDGDVQATSLFSIAQHNFFKDNVMKTLATNIAHQMFKGLLK